MALTAGKSGSRKTERWLSTAGLEALRGRNIHEAQIKGKDKSIIITKLISEAMLTDFLAKLGGKKVLFIELDDVARLVEGNPNILTSVE